MTCWVGEWGEGMSRGERVESDGFERMQVRENEELGLRELKLKENRCSLRKSLSFLKRDSACAY